MEDFNLKKGKPIITLDEDCITQQIDILFDTRPGDTHGFLDFGTDYESMLYELKLSEYQLESKMTHDLVELQLQGYEPEVTATILDGTERDIAVIEVNLSKGYNTMEKVYKIE